MSFIDDIQGQNTQLYPIVTIEPPDVTNWKDDFRRCTLLSTNSTSLEHIHINSDADSPINEGTRHHFKPLLLNIPSIKESIDIESRRFKISNVSLDISNIEYEGERFTDMLSDASLINWKVSIQFVSPTAQYFSTVYGVWTDNLTGDMISFYDGHTGNHNGFNNISAGTPFSQGTPSRNESLTKMVYQGVIRRISHDDTKCKIELEDLTEQKAHKDLPSESFGVEDTVPDKLKNKPKQMVYGYVDKCPLIKNGKEFLEEYEEDTITKLEIDYRDIDALVGVQYNVGTNAFYHSGVVVDDSGINIGIQHASIADRGNFIELLSASDSLNSSETFREIVGIDINHGAEDFTVAIPDPSSGVDDFEEASTLRRESISNDIYYAYDEDGSPNFSGDFSGDDGTAAPSDYPGTGSQVESDLIDNMEDGLARIQDGIANTGIRLESLSQDTQTTYHYLSFNLKPVPSDIQCETYLIFKARSSPYSHLGVAVTDDLSFIDVDGFDAYSVWVGQIPVIDTDDMNTGTGGLQLSEGGDWDNQVFFNGAYSENNFNSNPLAPKAYPVRVQNQSGVSSWDSIGAFNSFNIGSPKSHNSQFFTADQIQRADLFLQEVHLYHLATIDKLITRDYYGNIRGRVNTYNDHPFKYSVSMGYNINAVEGVLNDLLNYEEYGDFTYHIAILQQVSDGTLSSEVIDDFDHWLELMLEIAIQNLIIAIPDLSPFLENPIDIIYDLVRSELGHDAINFDDYKEARDAHEGWKFGFAVNKKISSKKLIEDIAKSTKCFPKFRNDGTFGFNTIKDSYDVANDYEGATLIKESEVISYSFKKTKPEQIYQKIDVQYKKNYAQDSYLKRTPVSDTSALFNTPYVEIGDYYGLGDTKPYLEFESDYIRDEETADALATFLMFQYTHSHLLFSLKLPLKYISLEIGDLVRFRDLFNGVKAYGIDYRLISGLGEKIAIGAYGGQYWQYAYPLFMITATTKNLDSVSIECMQLHHLGAYATSMEYQDWVIDEAWFAGAGEDDTEGTFYFADAEPVVVEHYEFAPDVETEEYVETDDRVETDNCFIHISTTTEEDSFGTIYYDHFPYLVNKDLERFDFTEYDGVEDNSPIFLEDAYVQIKSSTGAIIAKLSALQDTAMYEGVQRFRLLNIPPQPPISPWDNIDELQSFLKPDDWQEGDPLPLLEITRVNPVARTSASPVFNDKVKDLANIRDIKKW